MSERLSRHATPADLLADSALEGGVPRDPGFVSDGWRKAGRRMRDSMPGWSAGPIAEPAPPVEPVTAAAAPPARTAFH